jgi:hypothetical protein
MFDLNDFDEEAIAKKKEEEENAPPTFSAEELDAARAEGFQKGKVSGIDEERASLNQQILNTLQALKPHITELLINEEHRNKRFVDDSIAISLDALKKVFPEIYKAAHLEALKTYLKTTLTEQQKLTRLIIFVHPDTEKDISKYIDETFPALDTEKKILVKANPDLALGHAHIQWEHGGAIWTPLQLHDKILKDIATFLPPDYTAEEEIERADEDDIIKENIKESAVDIDESDKKAHNEENNISAPDSGTESENDSEQTSIKDE